ncbi:MAG: tetratricopeptide repeat protein, partial [Silicimonas sp.]|nr:tetratricopeptide repeat protein [Silicimonas sp.]
EACARADRRDPVALYNLGNVCMALGDEKAAQLAFERAIARDPEFAEARFNLAGLLERQGAQNAALEELRKTVEIAPDFPDALFNLAQIELATGDLDAAEARFRDYVSLTGSDGWQEKARKALQLIKLSRSHTDGESAKETS